VKEVGGRRGSEGVKEVGGECESISECLSISECVCVLHYLI
jgi:hypothetical protein